MNTNTCAPAVAAVPAEVLAPPHPAVKLLWTVRLILYGVLAATICLGGPLVSAMALCALVLALFTDLDGFARHVLRTLSLIAAMLAVSALGATANWILVPCVGNWDIYGLGPGHLAVGGVVMLAGMIVSLALGRMIRKRPWLRALNSMGGASLGAFEGALLVAVLYWTLSTFSGPLGSLTAQLPQLQTTQFSPLAQVARVQAYFDRDPLAGWMREHNVVAEVPIVATARTIADIATDREAVTELANCRELRSLLSHADLVEITAELKQDQALRDAYARRDVQAVLACARTSRLIDDPRVMDFAREHLPEVKSALSKMDSAKLTAAGEKLDANELNRLRSSARAIIGQVQTMIEARQKAGM